MERDYCLDMQARRFLELQKARAKKPETWGELREYVLKIIDTTVKLKDRDKVILHPAMDVRKITEQTVTDYYLALQAGSYTPGTKKKVFGFFRRLVRFLWSEKLIDLPRNLDERSFLFGTHLKKVKTYSPDLVQTTLSHLPERFRLYALLALNCGMYGVDMAKLSKEELDQEHWRIKCKRTKTEDHEDVPEVEYKLWPETVAVLRKHISPNPVYVLTSKTGTVLWDSRVEGDRNKKKDLIGQQWRKNSGSPFD